ncbi:MAG: Na/Pi cotransporter family protein [Prevotellaceae bacterium]|jgi:phosphate:Na+ symporter|nr:Na/Pi cotransporter family protein [Prevotellaceae bacterium]
MDLIFSILTLIGSIGLFLYGMMKMSDALQKTAGEKMRNVLASMTSNPLKRILTGALITSVIQSSSATTVMIVSFVNAGLMTLTQSVGVIMGANIGTTATAWIISLLGFKADIATLALPIIAFGVPMMMLKSKRRKTMGELLIGFALLFLGLAFMKNNMPDLGSNPQIMEFLKNYTDGGMLSVLLFVAVGTILTMIIQSSSATVALTLIMCANGWISFELAAAMVLGENIGTTITANMAAMVANVSARRAALAHTVFNIFGVVWVLILYHPFLDLVAYVSNLVGAGDPLQARTAIDVTISLSLFHSMFNIINTFILVWFTKYIVKIVTKLIKQKDTGEEIFRLRYITTGMMSTAALSLQQAKLEISHYAKRCTRMFSIVREMFYENAPEKFSEQFTRIEKYEDISDRIEVEIANYISKVSEGDLSELNVHRVQGMYKIIDEIESIADSAYNLARTLKRKNENKIEFDAALTKDLNNMFDIVQKALEIMNSNLEKGFAQIKDIHNAYECEKDINVKRSQLRDKHILNIENGKYSYLAGTVYTDLINEAEKLGDYIINVSEAIFEISQRNEI